MSGDMETGGRHRYLRTLTACAAVAACFGDMETVIRKSQKQGILFSLFLILYLHISKREEKGQGCGREAEICISPLCLPVSESSQGAR